MEMKELINQVLDGDTDTFELIIRKFQQKIYTFSYFMLGDWQEAEDATQEVFLKHIGIWRAIIMTVTIYFWHGCTRLRRIIAAPC